jgi:hypothetical protein
VANMTEIVGTYSEVAAELALMANGFIVSRPRTREKVDLYALDPVNNLNYRVQVKTIRKRADRNDELVVYATNGKGDTYAQTDVDYFIGVLVEQGESPRVFMFENRGCKEYWASEARAVKRWQELPLALNRELYEVNETEVSA